MLKNYYNLNDIINIFISLTVLSQLSPVSNVSPFSNFTVSCIYMMAEPKKCVEPQMEHSTLKTATAVTDLSLNIFLNTFSTVSCLYCISFLKFHCLMSLHDGRTPKKVLSRKWSTLL